MLLLGFDPVGKDLLAMLIEPGDTLGQKVLKKALFAPIAQAFWFYSVVLFESVHDVERGKELLLGQVMLCICRRIGSILYSFRRTGHLGVIVKSLKK